MESGQQSRKKKPLQDYTKYSVMGFQMAAIIGLGIFAGIKLDNWAGLNKTPLFTISFALLSVVLAIYFAVKDLLKK